MSSQDHQFSSESGSDTPSPHRLLTEYGVTNEGFERPGFETLWEVAVAEAERLFQRELTSPVSAELQYVEALVIWMDTAFDQLEALYYSAYYDHAYGQQLDHLLEIVGFRREEERQATGEVTFTSSDPTVDSDLVIPAGTIVKTEGDESTPEIYFRTREPATIPTGSGEVTQVPIRGLDPERTTIDLSEEQTGEETNVGPGEITTLHSSIVGVPNTGVTNPLPTGQSGTRNDGTTYRFERGRDRETDVQFKRRYENETFGTGTATLEAIEANLRAAGDGDVVIAARVDETLPITSTTDAEGNTVYSGRQIEPIVVLRQDTAANRDAVAQAIYDKRAAGIESVGAHTGTAITSNGEEYTTGLGFDIATEVPIYVDATIAVTEEFPGDGIEQITANLLDTIGGITNDGYRIKGVGIGEDLEYWDVVADVIDRDIPGLEGPTGSLPSDSIFVGTSASPTTTGDVAIADDQVAILYPENVTISTTPA